MSFLSRRSFLASAGAVLSAPRLFPSACSDPAAKDLRQSQLFLDDTWIEEALRLERSWVSAEILPEPVLRPETPWEGVQVVMFGSVLRLGAEWRMYYMTYNRPSPSLFCMATSADGIHWERPKLGLHEFRGSKANNIVWAPAPGETSDGPTVCHDPGDPKAPFKMLYFTYGGGKERGEYVAFSKDGVVWEHRPQPVLTNTGDRTNVMPVRDHCGRFVAFLRHQNMFDIHLARTVWRSESEDFIRWTDPEPILTPDLIDPPNTELYGMVGVPYEGMYLGFLERWFNNPDVIEVQLAWSHDGSRWQRPSIRRPFIAPTYPWNKGWNSCANSLPVRVGNQLWFYFGGRSSAHHRESPRSYGAVGLASTGLDQFAAIRGDFQEGRLTTKPMTWPGGDLALRCTNSRYPEAHPRSGGGGIAVEVRDEQNRPVEGFSGDRRARHDTVVPTAWSKTEPPVRWPGDRSLDDLRGRRIRLVFYLRDARLYSFRAAPRTATPK